MQDILVIDCQYDFIDGTLACSHAEEAVQNIIAFINANPSARVLYSADSHSINHCNYIHNGGIWPVHCQTGTHGAEIHTAFYTDITNPEQRPNISNIYYKGENDSVEEYSSFCAKNRAGHELNQDLGQDVLLCGIASEFCVRESALAYKNSGRKIEVPEKMLAWVDEAGHKKNIAELSAMGVKVA